MTHSPKDAHDLLARYGLEPRRQLGQNFVVDANTVRRIASVAGVGPGDVVVEIGGGLGSLTLALAETAATIITIELDHRLAEILRVVLADTGVTVIEADAASVDWSTLLADQQEVKLVANLPYNIATSLIVGVLKEVPEVGSMLVMVQREVGERLTAQAASRNVGIPSVIVAYHGVANIVGRVPAGVFYPRPNVESVLVEITRHKQPPVDQPLSRIEVLLRAAFGQRRKMLRSSLSKLIDLDGFLEVGVDSSSRPATLCLQDWSKLASLLDLP